MSLSFCRNALALTALILALTLPARDARAEAADREKPINYSADRGDVNYQTKVGTLTGKVIITQGTLTIHADKIIFKQNPDNSMSASAFGNPVAFRQKSDGSEEYFEGFAQHAEYDGSKQFLELFDRALLKKGKDEIRSNYITYNASTELFKAETRPPSAATPADSSASSRVQGVFQPKSGSAGPFGGDGAKDSAKGAAKDGAKDGAKGTPPAAPAAAAPDAGSVKLKPATEIAPPAK